MEIALDGRSAIFSVQKEGMPPHGTTEGLLQLQVLQEQIQLLATTQCVHCAAKKHDKRSALAFCSACNEHKDVDQIAAVSFSSLSCTNSGKQ